MVRDYSVFLPGGTLARREPTALEGLGWGPAFASQIDTDALTATPPVRVVAVHRSGLQVAGDGIDETIPPGPEATVGDWLLLDRARLRSSRVSNAIGSVVDLGFRSDMKHFGPSCFHSASTRVGNANAAPKGGK